MINKNSGGRFIVLAFVSLGIFGVSLCGDPNQKIDIHLIEQFAEAILDDEILIVVVDKNIEWDSGTEGKEYRTFSNGIVPYAEENYLKVAGNLLELYPEEFLVGDGDSGIVLVYRPLKFNLGRPDVLLTPLIVVDDSRWVFLLRSAFLKGELKPNFEHLPFSESLADREIFNERTLFNLAFPSRGRICLEWPDSEGGGDGSIKRPGWEPVYDSAVVEDLRKLIAAWQLAVTNENGLKFNPGPMETEFGLALKKEIQGRLGVDMGEEDNGGAEASEEGD